MKNNFIAVIYFVLIACFALPTYAVDDNPCYVYQDIMMTVYFRGNYVYYDLSNNGTIVAPHVDSVWITKGEARSIVATCHAQSGEPVYDVSSLERDYYILWVQIGECILARLFIARGVSSDISSAKENISASKILRDGQLFIIRDGVTYTATGQKVK